MNTIQFYSANAEFGCFSNFSLHPVELDGVCYPTAEHCFQAQKFLDVRHRRRILGAKTPHEAAKLGRSLPLRKGWESMRDAVMLHVVRAKVAQNGEVYEALLATGSAMLVEHTSNDSYWADGGDGSGKNRLGKILMRVRGELLDKATPPENLPFPQGDD